MQNSNYLKIVKPIIISAGLKAEKAWLNFNRSQSKLKNKLEIVTKVDRATEKMLTKNLRSAYPNYNFLGEEFGASKESSQTKKSPYTWIIDPIDGTTNFSIHNPLWSISIGLSKNDKIIFGAIYIPVLKELFWANLGKGAYLNNKRLKLKNKNSKNQKLIHTFCHGQRPRDLKIALTYYQKQKLNALDCRQLGSAAIELAYVAANRVDSIVIPGAKLWDIAAGALIAKEAGAQVVNFQKKIWTTKSSDIIATYKHILPNILKNIKI